MQHPSRHITLPIEFPSNRIIRTKRNDRTNQRTNERTKKKQPDRKKKPWNLYNRPNEQTEMSIKIAAEKSFAQPTPHQPDNANVSDETISFISATFFIAYNHQLCHAIRNPII